MGQKVNPVGMRIGITKDWNSRWFPNKKQDFPVLVNQDVKIREYITKKLPRECYLSHIEIERKKTSNNAYFIKIFVYVGRPGLVIGEKGATVKALESEIAKKFLAKGDVVKVNAVEIKPQNQNLDARIVALKIAQQLEARASFRIVQKRALQDVRKAGAKGCKTAVSGRLAGAEIARTEGYKDGTMAINTLRSDIDYACEEAMTTYGKLGVKVWICRGDNALTIEEKEKDAAKKGE